MHTVEVYPYHTSRVFALVPIALAVLCTSACSRKAEASLSEASPTVAVVRAERGDLSDAMTLQAEIHPYQDIMVHAKVAGFVKTISVDIGDRVKAGSAIATLEVPEASDELARSKAVEERAKADEKIARLSYERLVSVNKSQPNLVAQQDIDDAEAKAGAAAAAYDSAKADADRDQTLVDYTVITAPFDGIITKRFADPGALVQAGTSSSTQAMPLVELAQDSRLRIWFPVPEAETPQVKIGQAVTVRVAALGQSIEGHIVRTSGMIDHSTRTMTTEVDVENPNGLLTPGMYASIDLPLLRAKSVVEIPLQAVTGEVDPKVWVVNASNHVEERSVSLGIRTADKVEVKTGIVAGDQVIVGDRSTLEAGLLVNPKVVDIALKP